MKASTQYADYLHKEFLKLPLSSHIFAKPVQKVQNAKFGLSYKVFTSECYMKGGK